ncbi:MAG: O-antigen ligase family protein [Planctomycetes bacterium]|nr:O-antigen ligase family protein [Planctomycetota bacterium]
MNLDKYKHFSINRWKQGLSWGFTFALSFILGIYLVIAGGYTWRGDYSIHVANLVIGGLFIGGYLTWRMLKNRARLPRTGLELIILITFSIAILSWFISPDPRQGVSRLMLFALYIISFYLFLDVFDAGLNKTAAFHGLLLAGGLVILLAVYEVYQQYHAWWQTVGSFNILPPGPYRLTSILGHSNILMPYINLLAPMALVAFILARLPLGKVVYAVWLVLYLIMLPFTSSRGGWVGFLAWLGILILYWIWKAGFQRLRQLLWTKRLPGTRVLFILAGGIIGLAALKGYSYFSSHSSHGSPGANLFATRTGIWTNAIAVIKSNPLIGIGPGRFAFGYLAQGHDAPPGFWAMHAHNLPLELAAEFGLFGLLAVVILLLVGGYKVWKILQNSSWSEPDLWAIAAIAGIASFLVNCIVEDPTKVVPSMIMLVFSMAFILATPSILKLPIALPRFRNLGLGILWVPGLIILGLEG